MKKARVVLEKIKFEMEWRNYTHAETVPSWTLHKIEGTLEWRWESGQREYITQSSPIQGDRGERERWDEHWRSLEKRI